MCVFSRGRKLGWAFLDIPRMQYTHRWQSAARTSNNDASPLAPQPRGELRRTVRSISSIPDADSDQRLALRPIWLPSHPLFLPSLRSAKRVGAERGWGPVCKRACKCGCTVPSVCMCVPQTHGDGHGARGKGQNTHMRNAVCARRIPQQQRAVWGAGFAGPNATARDAPCRGQLPAHTQGPEQEVGAGASNNGEQQRLRKLWRERAGACIPTESSSSEVQRKTHEGAVGAHRPPCAGGLLPSEQSAVQQGGPHTLCALVIATCTRRGARSRRINWATRPAKNVIPSTAMAAGLSGLGGPGPASPRHLLLEDLYVFRVLPHKV